ncbi:hypothetical protein AJ85_03315 [Alkalihalobacillus alcalophilus ATCC 27647 = CGMCC 1.3604]|uniref:Uncharacterized protein n=1 Tax=Alkalihalobacillus alcalophilus ATCC 27647 = CGMCC 1.3604 TaxID=1218173 RepID=A0A4S4JTK1_ALKAL|nr:hypothetical protein AJ85_03315 [Alkalihalobacillus alcalophilus ATCC 27647 = CGMCC 1.3604]
MSSELIAAKTDSLKSSRRNGFPNFFLLKDL